MTQFKTVKRNGKTYKIPIQDYGTGYNGAGRVMDFDGKQTSYPTYRDLKPYMVKAAKEYATELYKQDVEWWKAEGKLPDMKEEIEYIERQFELDPNGVGFDYDTEREAIHNYMAKYKGIPDAQMEELSDKAFYTYFEPAMIQAYTKLIKNYYNTHKH